MEDLRKWIVVWTSTYNVYRRGKVTIGNRVQEVFTSGHYEDQWKVFEDFKEAESFYENLLQKDDTYTASITRILKSTDYSGENENL